MTIEERISRLEDIEAIRYLQAKYQRCLDMRDFDNLASCFIEDATSSYDDGKMTYLGKVNIIKFLCKVMKLNMPSTHSIHGGEIDIIDNENAQAKWVLEDHLIIQRAFVKLYGAAVYNIKYIKKDNEWFIKNIGYKRYFQYVELRGLFNLFSLCKKKVFKDLKNANIDSLGEYGQYFQYNTLKRKRK